MGKPNETQQEEESESHQNRDLGSGSRQEDANRGVKEPIPLSSLLATKRRKTTDFPRRRVPVKVLHEKPHISSPDGWRAMEATKIEESGDRATGARSFDCSFCKRGFSNAQALGGHMNMHRKDKAKLKHPSRCGNPFPSENAVPSYLPIVAGYMSPASHESACISAWRWSLPGAEDDSYRYGRLVDSARRSTLPSRASGHGSRSPPGGEVLEMQHVRHGLVEAELDLELRLGRSVTYLRYEDKTQGTSFMETIR
ncbi:hypothetical protein BHE74_00009737 [Ensete ventricosum]|nr:hypothetical protein GW17_00009224 [Ensete ventricosum]RWW81835.1 hypothetical protein BHE74_00009737 [Ensete ventricosum]